MSEIVKQEGDFKMPKPRKPRNLIKEDKVTKVDFSTPNVEEVTKVVIPNTEKDAIQEQSTNESVLRTEQSELGLQEVEQGNEGTFENVIEEISNEEVVKEEVKAIEQEVEKHVQEQTNTGKPLPENIEKLISFMEETGGTVEDYVRLNTDYSDVDQTTLLKEYYKRTKPHLDKEEIQFLLEDNFAYDEDIDEERDIRKKKLAFKEEVAKAKNFLEDLKGKYYEEIKLRPGVTKEQQKATDFFNRYNEEQTYVETQHSKFKDDTKGFFSQDFKGFDFKIGEKNFRYGVQNAEVVADKQSNITNLVKKFLNDKGEVTDLKGYHKAMYGAENIDTIASHFYEQGKADAIKEVVAKSNNTTTAPRQTSSGEIFINGLKVKAINGVDSTKLKIKKFNH
jgi:hypothetical protein